MTCSHFVVLLSIVMWPFGLVISYWIYKYAFKLCPRKSNWTFVTFFPIAATIGIITDSGIFSWLLLLAVLSNIIEAHEIVNFAFKVQ